MYIRIQYNAFIRHNVIYCVYLVTNEQVNVCQVL